MKEEKIKDIVEKEIKKVLKGEKEADLEKDIKDLIEKEVKKVLNIYDMYIDEDGRIHVVLEFEGQQTIDEVGRKILKNLKLRGVKVEDEG